MYFVLQIFVLELLLTFETTAGVKSQPIYGRKVELGRTDIHDDVVYPIIINYWHVFYWLKYGEII